MTQLIHLSLDTWELTSQEETVPILFLPLTGSRLLPEIPSLTIHLFGFIIAYPVPLEFEIKKKKSLGQWFLTWGLKRLRRFRVPLELYTKFSKVCGFRFLVARVSPEWPLAFVKFQEGL